jgi:hypothetical protein
MRTIALCAFVLSLTSCGLSEQERTAVLQAQKAKDDSIRMADLQRLKDAATFRSALSDSLSAYTTLLAHQQEALTRLRAVIYAANDELTRIRESHPGQTSKAQEKQEQKVQSLLVEQISLQAALEHSQAAIAQIRSQLTPAHR